jgi:hypothetical protein
MEERLPKYIVPDLTGFKVIIELLKVDVRPPGLRAADAPFNCYYKSEPL